MTTYYRSQDGKTISRGYGATNDSPPTQGGGWAVISSQERPDLYPQGTPANAGTPELTLPGMSATGNTPITTPAPTLPATNDTGSLVGFKDNMARVMTLAEQKRNDLLKQFMIPFKGTMPASDFTSLFSDFTAQSDQSNKMILERLIPKPDTQLITETDASGRITAITIDKNTGKVVNKEDLGAIGKPISSSEDLKAIDYKNADKFYTDNPDASYEDLRNNLLQHTKSLTSTEVDAFLDSKGKTKTPVSKDVLKEQEIKIKQSKDLGFTREEVETQIKSDLGKITEPIKTILDKVYETSTPEKPWWKFW